jgi:hypothetical protein
VLIVESMDPSILGTFVMCKIGRSQFMVTTEAVGLFASMFLAAQEEEKTSPMVLNSFTLDVNHLSQTGLKHAQNNLHLSRLEHFDVVCNLFEPSQVEYLRIVPNSVRWSTLESLVIHGDNFDEWIQLFPLAKALRLKRPDICGPAPDSQNLSHTSALVVHKFDQNVFPDCVAVRECPVPGQARL